MTALIRKFPGIILRRILNSIFLEKDFRIYPEPKLTGTIVFQ